MSYRRSKRTVQVNVVLTPAERAELEQLARDEDLTLSDVIRLSVKERRAARVRALALSTAARVRA